MTTEVVNMVHRAISSNKFFYIVLISIVSQALWYAVIIKPDLLFDELYHKNFIYAYTDYVSPFISTQPSEWDRLGDITRVASYMYHYLLSWPLRLVEVFTDSYFIQILVLRIMNIALAIVGLFGFKKVFERLGFSRALVNTSLFFFSLIPIFIPLSASVNYDNAIFALVPFILLLSFDIIQSKKVEATKILLLFILSMFATLIKYTILPFILVLFVIAFIALIKKHRSGMVRGFIKSLKKAKKPFVILLLLLFFLLSFLIIERPITNLIEYSNFSPSCTDMMTRERCLQNYTAARDITLLEIKSPDFRPFSPFEYFLTLWLPSITVTTARLVQEAAVLPVLHLFFFSAVFVGVPLALIYSRNYAKNRLVLVVLVPSMFYMLALFTVTYSSYVKFGNPVAMNGRYILLSIPLLVIFIGMSLSLLIKRRELKVVTLIIAVFFLLQGGGIATAIMTIEQKYYWENSYVIRKNEKVKSTLKNFIKEKNEYLTF